MMFGLTSGVVISPKIRTRSRLCITAGDLSLYSRDFARGVKSRLSERLAGDLKVPESQILLSEGSEDMMKQAVHCYLARGETILCPVCSRW